MSRIIPNEQTWVGFSETRPVDLDAPTADEIDDAIDLTCFVISINASAQGNTIPTPSLCSLFETQANGTVSATFTGDFYRDDTKVGAVFTDLAWNTLKRAKKGYFFISRFGGSGPNKEPVAGQGVEVWPTQVVSRTAAALTSNTAQTFSVNAAVFEPPAEDAVVAA